METFSTLSEMTFNIFRRPSIAASSGSNLELSISLKVSMSAAALLVSLAQLRNLRAFSSLHFFLTLHSADVPLNL